MKGDKGGYVYLLANADSDDTYKIGVTRGDINKRIKKLQTGSSGEIYLCSLYYTKHPFFVESNLHLKYVEYKKRDEWFIIPNEEALKFKEYCEDVEKMIDSLRENPFFNIK